LDDFHVPLELEYGRNPSFTGREADLRYIHDFIKLNDSRKRPLTIYGIGGVGKTQLVRDRFHIRHLDHRSDNPDDPEQLSEIHAEADIFLCW
jgi:predicted AAA+ superfamily ATPase